MGMRVGGPSSAAPQQSSSVNNWQQRQNTINSLTSALSAGNLSAAQNAFATLTGSYGASATSATNASNATSSTSNSTTSTANATGGPAANSLLAQIGQALANGDLATAQKLGQTLQSSSGHHHHHGGQATSATASTTASSSNTQPISFSTSGGLINTTA